MKHTTIHDCKLIDLRKIADPRGNLTVVEENQDVPFDIKRVYYLYDVPGGESRGAHAHKALYQLLVAANGSFSVTLGDGKEKVTYNLKRPYVGLLIVPGIWRDLDDFSSGSVCLCLASEHYEAADYIRDYNEFIEYKQI
jgi:dTDP-4-dehydrorhamnose 3,5-epimerase-like enzyme